MWSPLILALALGHDGGVPGGKRPVEPTRPRAGLDAGVRRRATEPPEVQIKSTVGLKLDVRGPLDIAPTDELVRGKIPAFRDCFERSLKASPKAFGRFGLVAEIAASGAVGEVSLTTDTLRDPKVVACVSKVVSALRFPKAAQEAQLDLAFTFKSLQ